jgi:aryl-alcohol dehydrogenase-like predicted oxidoreductase
MGRHVGAAQMPADLTGLRLALGTVQFGLDYGIANSSGRVSLVEASSIVRRAKACGVDTLDTAIAYGESESTLGRIGVLGWKIVTKLPELPQACEDVENWVMTQIGQSIEKLGVDRLHAVLLHRPSELLGEHGVQLFQALESLKARGWAKKIGISIYDPRELGQLSSSMYFDLVQAPLNILDRRLVESGCTERLARQGTEVHVRSAFLQGLLLMTPEARPAKFSRWSTLWSVWDAWLHETGLTPLQACLAYVLAQPEVDRVVVGVDNPGQLDQITNASQAVLPSLPNVAQLVSPELINPGHWSSL